MTELRETLKALVALQQIDKQIVRVKRTLSSMDNGAAAVATAARAGDEQKAKVDAHHHAIGALKDTELKLASVEAKHKSYEQKLYQGTVTSPKELANIEKEIAALHRQRSDLDGRVLELMDEVEVKRTDAEVAKVEFQAAEDMRQTVVAQLAAQRDQLNQEMEMLTCQRPDAQSLVNDPRLLKRYDDIRAKSSGIGIAQIVNQNCGGCSMTLPTAQIKIVKDADTEVQVCENCGRLLAP